MNIKDSFSLSYARFRFTMVANEDAKLPLYLRIYFKRGYGTCLASVAV